MKSSIRYALGLALIAITLFVTVFAFAEESAEKKGWGLNDPYNELYNPKDFEKLKVRVVKAMEVVPMPGMSPATALEVSEGSSAFTVHLCPVWFAKPADVGVKPGDKVTIKGAWAEIGGKDVFLASKVKKGESQEFKVRLTKDGTPFWTMTPEQIAKERENDDN